MSYNTKRNRQVLNRQSKSLLKEKFNLQNKPIKSCNMNIKSQIQTRDLFQIIFLTETNFFFTGTYFSDFIENCSYSCFNNDHYKLNAK